VKYRNLRRFLTLFAACVVSLCAAAYLSFEAASQQEGASRQVALAVDDSELTRRRTAMEARGANAWKPAARSRKVSMALKAYAAMTTSAARGAVRVVRD